MAERFVMYNGGYNFADYIVPYTSDINIEKLDDSLLNCNTITKSLFDVSKQNLSNCSKHDFINPYDYSNIILDKHGSCNITLVSLINSDYDAGDVWSIFCCYPGLKCDSVITESKVHDITREYIVQDIFAKLCPSHSFARLQLISTRPNWYRNLYYKCGITLSINLYKNQTALNSYIKPAVIVINNRAKRVFVPACKTQYVQIICDRNNSINDRCLNHFLKVDCYEYSSDLSGLAFLSHIYQCISTFSVSRPSSDNLFIYQEKEKSEELISTVISFAVDYTNQYNVGHIKMSYTDCCTYIHVANLGAFWLEIRDRNINDLRFISDSNVLHVVRYDTEIYCVIQFNRVEWIQVLCEGDNVSIHPTKSNVCV